MKHGDFTELAKYYVDRPGYSKVLLDYIKTNIQSKMGQDIKVADVGAGTGKLTENLEEISLTGYAIEPNKAMRSKGQELFNEKKSFIWKEGSAENTGLPDHSVDWILMGSSFHWTDSPKAANEFKRILKPGGFFTAIWNPRDIERSKLHMEIENIVYDEIPEMERVSSGNKITTEYISKKLLCGDIFHNLIFLECQHEETMTKERYMNIWRSVNDIHVQAGEEGFKRILNNIETMLQNQDEIVVPYKSRAWTAQLIE